MKISSSTSIRSTSSTRPCWRRRESAASTSDKPPAPVRGPEPRRSWAILDDEADQYGDHGHWMNTTINTGPIAYSAAFESP